MIHEMSSKKAAITIAIFYRSNGSIDVPTMLVNAVKHIYQSHAEIVFLTDQVTPCPERIDRLIRYDFSSNSLMHSRLQAYSWFQPQGPTIYIDCDMLPARVIDQKFIESMKGSYGLCLRSYNKHALFNSSFRGLDFSFYKGMSLGEVFPILASFSYAEDNKLWTYCLKYFESLPAVFYKWYGDQEAMKRLYQSKELSNIRLVEERIVSRLPEDKSEDTPLFIHFKGNRKDLMQEYYDKIITKGLPGSL